jgi:lipoyl(octanoyl) transferase
MRCNIMIEWITSTQPVPYPEAIEFMDRRVEAIHKGTAPECIWLLEHPPLYTAGTSSKDADLLNPRFPVFKTGRGGQYTYHGPGQRVVYVMVDLKKRGAPDIKKYVCDLERWIINTLEQFGIKGKCIDGRVGVWVDDDSPPHPSLRDSLPPMGGGLGWGGRNLGEGEKPNQKKIAAIGVRVRHWVTLHGVSINASPDLDHFSGIVPCGIGDAGVTSFKDLGLNTSMTEIDNTLKTHCPWIS